MGGYFHDSNASSFGAFASGGAAGYFGPAYAGTPSQQGQPFAFGAYGGAGASVWFSNAHTAQQLAGPFTTYSLNFGAGIAKGLSLQLSIGGRMAIFYWIANSIYWGEHAFCCL